MRKFDFISCKILFPLIALISCIAAYSNGNLQNAFSTSGMAFFAWLYYDAEYRV